MPEQHPDETELAALRALAKLVAPLVKDLLDESQPPSAAPRATPESEWDEEAARELVRGLPADVLDGAELFFRALGTPPYELDSIQLADWTGISTRELSGRLLRPIQQHAKSLNRNSPNQDGLPWSSARAAPKGHLGTRTVWRADPKVGALIFRVFEEEAQHLGEPRVATEEPDRRPDVPAPSAVFIYRPEQTTDLDEAHDGWSSCLRDSEPGSRAVIYRALSDQKLVAIFDVISEPEWDREWAWMARGRFTPITAPIPRAELLATDALRPVFEHIQGRRRLPPPAQEALVDLIQGIGKTRLPRHPIFEEGSARHRRARFRSRRA